MRGHPARGPDGKRRRPERKPGLSPGTLVAHPDAHPTHLRVARYDAGKIAVGGDTEAAAIIDDQQAGGVLWIDIAGLDDAALLQRLGERFGLHPLVLEDAIHVHQRPKVESYGADLFVVMRTATIPGGELALRTEQVGMLVREGLVITFHEKPSDVFAPVRHRLEVSGPRIRKRGADYLAYALLDAVVDGFLPVVDRYGEAVEVLEERILHQPDSDDLLVLHRIRRDLIALRRVLVPLREAVHGIVREGSSSSPFDDETLIFLRDCYDHAVRTLEQVDSDRELAASLMELYLSTVSNRTNDVMKVLTMIATIFIPLSFMVGLYGMNFDTSVSPWNMPELSLRYGYPLLLGLMALVAAGFVWFFRRKNWF